MVTLAAVLQQSLDSLPFWELHRQVHHMLKKKKNTQKKLVLERAWYCW